MASSTPAIVTYDSSASCDERDRTHDEVDAQRRDRSRTCLLTRTVASQHTASPKAMAIHSADVTSMAHPSAGDSSAAGIIPAADHPGSVGGP